MLERKHSFSEDEKDGIRFQARELANLGPDAIFDAEYAGIVLNNDLILGRRKLDRKQTLHEVDVIYETVRQARVLLQVEGRDVVSILSSECERAGLGSLFDPESEAYKKFGGLLRD